MPKKSPYAPELIQKCIDLYKVGVSVETIAKNSGVPMRTLYRWLRNASAGKPVDPDMISNEPNFKLALQAKVTPHRTATTWVDDVEATLDRLGEMHNSLISDLYDLLQSGIHTSDPSPRAINTLSLCLDRHATSLLRVVLQGRDKQVDLGQSISTLEAYGYSVFDSSRLLELFGSELQNKNPFETADNDDNEE